MPSSEVDRNALVVQLLPEYRAWLRKVASGLLSPVHEALDDLVQEGFIAMWRAVGSLDPDRAPADYWLKRAAHQRMLTVLDRDGAWTGLPDRREGGHGGRRADRPVLSIEVLSAAIDEPFDVQDVLASAAIDRMLDAYHHGYVVEAMTVLTPREREYVVRRFWHGQGERALDQVFATSSKNIWTAARRKLRAELVGSLT